MSVYKRGTSWTVQISWYEPDEKEKKKKFKTKGGFRTKAEAKKWETEQLSFKNTKKLTNNNPVFSKYFWEWANTYRLPGKSDGTKRRYTYVKRVIEKYFGQTRINDINRSSYQKFINEYGENHSKITIKKLNGLIKSCVSDAYEDAIISQNFTNRINEVWNDKNSHQVEYLSIKEIRALLKATKLSLNSKYTCPYAVLTAIETGMRAGEILALKWSDINYSSQTISINKSYDYISKKIKPPKNESSNRVIYVSKSFLKTLNQLKSNNHEFIFAKQDGSLPTDNALNKSLKKLLTDAKINKKGFHFHSLRHCHVAYLVAHHVDWYEISKRLGHSNIGITMDTYSYMIDEMKATQQKILANALEAMDKPTKLKLA